MVLGRGSERDGRETAIIETWTPWGLEATNGTTVFEVFAEQIVQT